MTVPQNVSRETLEQLVVDSGLWAGDSRYTHSFLLSPSVYQLSAGQTASLRLAGKVIHESLIGLAEISAIASNQNFCRGLAWRNIRRALKAGVPDQYHSLQMVKPSSVTSICKVDFMELADGTYAIAEIDGHNKHGMGYSTLAGLLRSAIDPSSPTLPGVAKLVADEVKKRNPACEVVLLYADQERFYLPEFRIIAEALQREDVRVLLINEVDVPADGRIKNAEGSAPTLYVDLPFLFHHKELQSQLEKQYRAKDIDFLIPPKPFMGSKGLLALLRNDERNMDLEVILLSHIPADTLDTVRGFIPETRFLSESNGYTDRYVIKDVVSSGMKGTVFSSDHEKDVVLNRAKKARYRYVFQKEVQNREQDFAHFTPEGGVVSGKWFARVTAHYVRKELADLVVTARQDKKVHGAKDCIQLGTILV